MKLLNQSEVSSFIKGKTIAIVGSSPDLKNSSQGKLIDSHDVVVRFNDAVLFNNTAPNDYGHKCNLWAISGWSSYYDENKNLDQHQSFLNTNKPYIIGTRPLRNDNPTQLAKGLMMRGPIFNLISNNEINYIDTPKEIFNLPLLGGYFNLSSGLAALLLLIHFNPKNISLLGFNFFDYNKPTHFWDNKFIYTKEMKEQSIGHNGAVEKQIIDSISHNFNIKIY